MYSPSPGFYFGVLWQRKENGIIHDKKKKKKKLFTHSAIVIEHLYVPATVLSLELVLDNIEKSTCFMQTYLLAGETDNKSLTQSIKVSPTGYG